MMRLYERIVSMLKALALRKTIFSSLALLLLVSAAMASGPVFWEISKQEDVLKGDARAARAVCSTTQRNST